MTDLSLQQAQSTISSDYEAQILDWRQKMETDLRSEYGWLTLTGLYWLHEGLNSLGSDPTADVLLPESAPNQLGTIEFHDRKAWFHVSADVQVTADGNPVRDVELRNDYDPEGATRVEVGSVNFFVVERGDQYGIRVRDRSNPARQSFTGRVWFPVDPGYRVTATFTSHTARTLDIMNMVGILSPMENPGSVEFTLAGHTIRLEAFKASKSADEIWFVFRDTHPQVYRASRFLYAPLHADGTVTLDFNKAYSPPCAFTPYATCPLPPKENILKFPVPAGEQLSPSD